MMFSTSSPTAGLGERRRIRHGEGHVKNARERLREQRLAGSRGTYQQDVRLGEFNLVVLGLVMEALVVVVDGDRQHLLRMILANHVIVENLADFLRRWDPVPGFAQSGLGILAADIRAQLNAFIADEHRRPSDELADLMLALPAERAVERILRIAARDLAHSCLSSPPRRHHIGDEFGQHNVGNGVRNPTKRGRTGRENQGARRRFDEPIVAGFLGADASSGRYGLWAAPLWWAPAPG
jgi:hypothetical protein